MERYRISTLLKKNTTVKIVICILGVLLFKTCKFPDEQHFIIVTNNANHEISFYVGETYPDTSIVQTKPHLWTVQPNSSFNVSEWGTMKERFRKIEKLSVFIFHTDTLNKYTWEEVADKYMILERNDLSFEDLKRNFTVTYP
jgi:hypothetical protein